MTALNVYCDEIIRPGSNNVIILGALFIKDIDINRVLDQLENSRCLNTPNHKWYYDNGSCPNKESCNGEWHNKNNTKIHFRDIDRSRERKNIAKKWLTLLKSSLIEHVKFSILVIDLTKLDCKFFGQNKTDLNIYNKFFRTLLKGGLRYLYNNKYIHIKQVYHDEGSQEKHIYFPELNLQKLEIETSDDFIIQNKKINFVNDDHRKYLYNNEMDLVKHSNFIQFIDAILGSFSQLFLNLSNKDDKKEVAEVMREVFDSIFNKKWEYPYSVSFFPRYSLSELTKINQYSLTDFDKNGFEDQIATALKYPENFYNKTTLTMPKFIKNQQLLTAWGI